MKYIKTIVLLITLSFSMFSQAGTLNGVTDKIYSNLITIQPTEVDWSFVDTTTITVPADGYYQLIAQENNFYMLKSPGWQYGLNIESVWIISEAPSFEQVTSGFNGVNTRLRKFFLSDKITQEYYLAAGVYVITVTGRCTLVQTNSAQGHQGYFNLELRAMP